MPKIEGDKWLRCPGCNSTSVQKYGKIMSRTGEKQRIRCTSCGKVFYQGKRLRKNAKGEGQVNA